MKKVVTLAAVLALGMFGLAACGGDDDNGDETEAAATTEAPAASGPGGTVVISAAADNSFAYDQESVSAKPGDITIEFDNPAALSHDVVVEDAGGNELAKTDLVAQDSATTTASLDAGSYTFFCSVPGHREGGMEGALQVK